MSRFEFVIHRGNRETLAQKLLALPTGWRIVFQEPKRTVDQNSRMWVLLTAISTQLVWHGQRYAPEDWKDHFCHILHGGRFMPSEDGGMIPIGRSTSKLSKQEHTLLQEIIEGFAERHGVDLKQEAEHVE